MMIDSHCHLDLDQFDADRGDILARAQAAGVGLIVNPGIDLAHSCRAIALAEQYDQVYAAVGIHPNSSGDFDQAMLDEVRALAAHPKVVAIGEIGLDYYWDDVAPAKQAIAFQAQLELAADLGLPVIIHNRDASEDVARILREWVFSGATRNSPLATRPFLGVLHAFSGDLAMAQEAYEWGFVLSLGGPVTFKNARNLHDLVPHLRQDRLMLETDAPYLTPHPYRGKRNEPSYIPLICDRLAELFGVTSAEMAATSTALALKFFGLENFTGAESHSEANAHL
ncbi:MAG: TatD family hydrolase [Caldilineaceae bacterium]|nr:TatD family hydrolase [Caldilineaceae bacterium]MBP8106958.1 TatD family hydrolase [Caldilineaceae bacterium]MBP8121772.1 TatD family hydrolase [Caldilineaceae bacterium]MBP9072376.1 TatD family hydrolase [Caldilineaceae bacterium]